MSTYSKPYLTVEQQVEHIKTILSCNINDEDKAKNFLSRVGYYKVQQYFSDLKSGKIPLSNSKDSVLFEDVIFLYEMDRKISGLFFICLTEIEIGIRSKFCEILATDPFGYHDNNFWYIKAIGEQDARNINRADIKKKWLDKLKNKVEELEKRNSKDLGTKSCKCTNSCRKSNAACGCKGNCNYNCACGCAKSIDPIVLHIKENNPNPKHKLPLWVALELLDFGALSYLYEGMSDNNRKLFSSSLQLDVSIMLSSLKSLNVLRNYCAHNNKIIGNITFAPPKINILKSSYPDPSIIKNTSNVFGCILACYHFMENMNIDKNNLKEFYSCIEGMVSYDKYNYSHILGIDEKWKNCPVW